MQIAKSTKVKTKLKLSSSYLAWRIIRPAIIGLVIAMAGVLLTAAYIVGAPANDLQDLALFLLASSIPSFAIGYIIFFLGQQYLRSIYAKILLSGALGAGIVLVNIYVTSRLMFLNEHDFILLTLLLMFSALISIPFAVALAALMSEPLTVLKAGTERIAQGNLTTRIETTQKDEIADVAIAFNTMADNLEESFKRQQELEQARRDLIAAVSHDLRTPLASIRVMAEALVDQVVTDPETIDRYHRNIQNQVSNLALLIDDLFELAKLDSAKLELKLEPGNMVDLISDTLESMRAQAAIKNIALNGRVERDLPAILMEEAKIQRVLYNLIQNAIRHTPADGSVSIIASPTERGVKIDVADTGEGIPFEDLSRIFDEFYRGEKSRNRSTGGSGLGLAIVKRIIEAHGGEVSVQSQVEEGTIFSFILPSYEMSSVRH